MNPRPGIVYLVGAGPGDPELITVKGRECLQRAEVVVYDQLVHPSLLLYAANGAELIHRGRRSGDALQDQKSIHQILIEKAGAGKCVVRLKGGDPLIFARGAEEILALHEAGIPYEIVPGITAAFGVSAYAGIPSTHRHMASSVTLVTGYEDPERTESRLHWRSLVETGGTLIFYMGAKTIAEICKRLVQAGLDRETPAAFIHSGTTAAQKTIIATIDSLSHKVSEKKLGPPALVIVGDVVRLGEHWTWHEEKPLFGRRIVVTRGEEQAEDLAGRLRQFGAEALEIPCIEICPLDDYGPLDHAIGNLGAFDWIIFTSVNGARFFMERLFACGRDNRALAHVKIAAIGPATAGQLKKLGLAADLMPRRYVAEEIAAELENMNAIEGRKFLLPRSALARPALADLLIAKGGEVMEIPTYTTRMPGRILPRMRE